MFGAIQRVISGENIQHQLPDQQQDDARDGGRHQHQQEQQQGDNGDEEGRFAGGVGEGQPSLSPPPPHTSSSNNSPIDMIIDPRRRGEGGPNSFRGPVLVEDDCNDMMMDIDHDHDGDGDDDERMGVTAAAAGNSIDGGGGGISNTDSPIAEVTHVERTDNSTAGSSISDVSNAADQQAGSAHFPNDDVETETGTETAAEAPVSLAAPLLPRASGADPSKQSVSGYNNPGATSVAPTVAAAAAIAAVQNTPPRPQAHAPHHHTFRDSDSRASSQNSSRDWGWFEDVHMTGSADALPALDTTKRSRKSTGGDGASSPSPRQGASKTSKRSQAQTNTTQRTAGGDGKHTNEERVQHKYQHDSSSPSSGLQLQPQPSLSYDPASGGIVSTPTGNKFEKRSNSGSRTYTGLLPNIGLMMESPNHSSSGGDLDDDYYFNPTSQELLEPIIIPGISPRDMEDEAAVQAVTAPNYVLEESLSSQKLWKDTAGNRPPQPLEERAFFEMMWAQNFARSQVEYKMPVEVLTATTPISLSPFADNNFGEGAHSHPPEVMSNYNLGFHTAGDGFSTGPGGSTVTGTDVAEQTLVSRLNDPRGQHYVNAPLFTAGIMSGADPYEIVNRKIKSSTGSNEDLIILIKGDNVFGTTVSKSFARPGASSGMIAGVDTVNISIASYRVVESKKHGKYAQFLVIYREGSIRDTIGVWKRYSAFKDLANKVTKASEGCAAVMANISPLAVTDEQDVEHLPNAITSWRLLKKRQRWYRCLDAGYLSLKVFLLERFLHDILFESSTPTLLREFVGVPPPPRRGYRS